MTKRSTRQKSPSNSAPNKFKSTGSSEPRGEVQHVDEGEDGLSLIFKGELKELISHYLDNGYEIGLASESGPAIPTNQIFFRFSKKGTRSVSYRFILIPTFSGDIVRYNSVDDAERFAKDIPMKR